MKLMIYKAKKEDALTVAGLAIQMWEDNEIEELAEHFERLVTDENAACFLKYEGDAAVGFAQCQLRHDYVEGTETSPVGYLEGILVEEAFRHKGYAKELLRECEKWVKSKGCTEFASDCELENEESLRFHMAMKFEEANRVICFRKSI